VTWDVAIAFVTTTPSPTVPLSGTSRGGGLVQAARIDQALALSSQTREGLPRAKGATIDQAIALAATTRANNPRTNAATPGVYQPLSSGFLDRTIVVDGVSRAYKIYIPPSYDPGVAHRVIQFCCGSGEEYTGSNAGAQINVGLGDYIQNVTGNTFPDVVVFGQPPSGGADTAAGHDIPRYDVYRACLDATIAEVNTDLTRVVVTGISGGATHCFTHFYQQPGRFCFVAPVATGLFGRRMELTDGVTDAQGRIDLLAQQPNFPMHEYCGANDSAHLARCQADNAAFGAGVVAGYTYTEMAGIGHSDCWDNVYGKSTSYDGGAIATAFWAELRAAHL